MVNYQNSKIYKLWSPSKNIVYIGSTTQPLCKRLVVHLSYYKAYNNDNTKKYYTSFMVLECNDYKIELLEEYKCNNRQQLEQKEGEYIKNNECCNKYIAGRTTQEYYIDNIDKIKEQSKQYRITNADKIKEQMKEYYITNADKIKEHMKEYYINNADKKKKYDKQYAITNADKKKEYLKQYYLKKKAEK